MTILTAVLLFFVSVVAGAINAVAGGGTFLTFPVLLMTGMPSIAANATNTMALWPGSLASAGAFRAELAVHKVRLPLLMGISLIGGLIGAMLLLATPETTFTGMVPWLLLGATMIFAFGRRITAFLRRYARDSARYSWALTIASFMLQIAIAIYGGFFGAGIGILMLAMLQLLGMHHIHEMNALKTLMATAINGVAVITFIVADVILWPQALLMMAGAVIGGYGGAHYSKKLPPETVRKIVMVIGFTMTAYFFVKHSRLI